MQKVKISEVCKISNGFAFKSEKYVSSDGARVIRITNVQKGKIVDNDPKLYPFSEVKNLENYKINEGDIMMSLTGNVGRVGKFPKELLPAYINQRVCRIKSNTEKLSDDYLFHFLNSDKFENDAIRNSAGAAQLNLSTNWLAEYEIPLPDLPTQQKIAAILDKADELRQYNQQLIEKYDALTQSLFLDMFGDPVKNEKGWEVKKMFLICDITSSRRIFKDEYVESGIPFYRTKEIVELSKNKKITSELFISTDRYEEIKKDNNIPQFGDILLSAVGTIGIMWIVDTNEPFYFKDGNLIWLKMSNSKGINSKYFKMTLDYLIEHEKNNLAQGAAYNALTIDKLKKFQVNIAPIEIQNQFAERIKLIEAQKQQAQEALAKSEALFQGLLQMAFNGELS